MRNEGAGDLALRLALIQVSAVGVAPTDLERTDLERIISGNPKEASDKERAISVALPANRPPDPRSRAVNGCP